MSDKKKGLVIIYDPHALYQFLMFYCMEKEEVLWDVLCLPKEDGQEEMHELCEKTEIFEKVFTGNIEYAKLDVLDKLKMFIKMVFYAFAFKRKTYCKQVINSYVKNIEEYDVLVGNTESGLITGMLASFADQKKVIYFEDGMADYWIERKGYKTIFPWYSTMNIQGLLMSKLGYCSKGFCSFRLTKKCYKYASNVTHLLYRNYKEINEFFLDDKQKDKFKELLYRIYPELQELLISTNAAILFTDPPSDIYIDKEDCIALNDACVNQIDGKYNIIYLKRHPRDNSEYIFKKTKYIIEINQDIPSECILPLLDESDCYFTDLSSTIINLKTYGLKPIIFIDENRNTKKITQKTFDRRIMEDMCEKLVGSNYEVRSVL